VTRQSATVDATPRQNDATERDSDAERIAELKTEVSFLRGLVEQRDRDGAEVRAALREALKLAPKQLEAGRSAPPQRAETGAAGTNSPGDATVAPRPVKRDGAALSYGDIADALELSMRK
jgi:hypothetical protein